MIDHPACAQGHDHHPTTLTEVRLGEPHLWADYPPIPERFACAWEIEAFDASGLDDRGGYCPGLSNVSATLLTHHLWEPPETIAMLCAMERWSDAPVVDIGANIGYYATMAMWAGHEVWAFEPDHEAYAVLERNVNRCPEFGPWMRSGAESGYWLNRHPVGGPDGWPVPMLSNERYIVKIDVEGMEPDVIAEIHPKLNVVHFIMMEVTPDWDDRYRGIICDLPRQAGLRIAVVPAKDTPPARFDTFDDLDWHDDGRDVWKQIWDIPQSTVLFARM